MIPHFAIIIYIYTHTRFQKILNPVKIMIRTSIKTNFLYKHFLHVAVSFMGCIQSSDARKV